MSQFLGKPWCKRFRLRPQDTRSSSLRSSVMLCSVCWYCLGGEKSHLRESSSPRKVLTLEHGVYILSRNVGDELATYASQHPTHPVPLDPWKRNRNVVPQRRWRTSNLRFATSWNREYLKSFSLDLRAAKMLCYKQCSFAGSRCLTNLNCIWTWNASIFLTVSLFLLGEGKEL
jgi:hypothetical protein